MKKILLIGKNGFLGRRINYFLKQNKYDILSTSKQELNLLSQKNINKFIKKYKHKKFDYIFNCAAYTGGQGLIEKHSIKMMLDNTQMTINFHKIIENFKVKKIIFIGSACAYPDSNKLLLEKNFWNGKMSELVSSYGITKKFDFIYQNELKRKFKINYVHYNLANLYGPNDKFNPSNSHVLGSLIYKFCFAKKNKKKKVEVWGTGKPIRDFIYIDDAAKIIAKTFKNITGIINIGSGQGISVKQLSNLIKKSTKYNGQIFFNKKKKDGVFYKVLSNKKLSKYYNVKKITTLSNGIKKTLNWFNENYL